MQWFLHRSSLLDSLAHVLQWCLIQFVAHVRAHRHPQVDCSLHSLNSSHTHQANMPTTGTRASDSEEIDTGAGNTDMAPAPTTPGGTPLPRGPPPPNPVHRSTGEDTHMEQAEDIETPATTISVNIPANTPHNPTHIPANTQVHNPVQDLQPMAHRVAGAVAQAFLEQGVSLNVALAYIPRQWWNMNSATIHINYMTPAAALHPNALYFDNDEETEAVATGGTATGGATGATGSTDTHHAAIVTGDTTVEHTALSSSTTIAATPKPKPRKSGPHLIHSCGTSAVILATQCFLVWLCANATSVRHMCRSVHRPNKVPTGAQPDRSPIAQPAHTWPAQTGHTEMAGFDLQSLQKGIAMLLYVSDNAATCYPSTSRFSTTRSARYTLCTLAVVLAGVLQWHTYSYLITALLSTFCSPMQDTWEALSGPLHAYPLT